MTAIQSTQITEMESMKRNLYEKFVLREITAAEYKETKAELDAECERLKNTKSILAKETAKQTPINGLRQLAEGAVKAKLLSRELVDVLIDRVRVYPGNKVEMVWKVKDFDASTILRIPCRAKE